MFWMLSLILKRGPRPWTCAVSRSDDPEGVGVEYEGSERIKLAVTDQKVGDAGGVVPAKMLTFA